MWKIAFFALLLPGLAVAQFAVETPPKSVSPLAGVTFWPKAPAGRPPFTATVTRIRVSNLPEPRLPLDKVLKLGDSINRTLGKPGSGRCATPLAQLMTPAGRNFTLQRLVPTPSDGNFVAKPAVPSCEG